MNYHGTYSNKIENKSLLLDLFPKVNCAYSLRKLRRKYNGPAITVTNITTNQDKDIYFINNELDINTLLAFANNQSVGIKLWHDQSKNYNGILTSELGTIRQSYYGVPFNQTNTSNMPRIINNGSLYLLNNKPCIYFNGTNYHMNRNDSGMPTSDASFISVSYSLSSSLLLNTYQSILHYGSGSSGSAVFLSYGDDANYGNDSLGASNYGNAFGTTNRLQTQNIQFVTKPKTTGVWNQWINNSIASSKSMQTNTTTTNLSTGCRTGSFNSTLSGGYLNGYIQEIICWDVNYLEQRNQIEQNVNNYYKVF